MQCARVGESKYLSKPIKVSCEPIFPNAAHPDLCLESPPD